MVGKKTEAKPEAQSAGVIGQWSPAPEYFRGEALRMAINHHGGNGRANAVIETAEAFLAFLKA